MKHGTKVRRSGWTAKAWVFWLRSISESNGGEPQLTDSDRRPPGIGFAMDETQLMVLYIIIYNVLDLLHHLYVRVYPLAGLGQSAMAIYRGTDR